MKLSVLLLLAILSTSAMAYDKILVGTFLSGSPSTIKFYKTRAGEVGIYAETYRDEEDGSEESFSKIIPDLEVKGKRDLYCRGKYAGKLARMFYSSGSRSKKSVMEVVTEKEVYCSSYYGEDDCISTAIRYNIFLIIK